MESYQQSTFITVKTLTWTQLIGNLAHAAKQASMNTFRHIFTSGLYILLEDYSVPNQSEGVFCKSGVQTP